MFRLLPDVISKFLTSFWLVCQYLTNFWRDWSVPNQLLRSLWPYSSFYDQFLTSFWNWSFSDLFLASSLTYLVISWLVFDIFGRNLTRNNAKVTGKTRPNLVTHSRHFSSDMTYSSEFDVNMTSIFDVRISSDIDVKWTSERRHWRRGQEMTSIWRYTDEKCLLGICWLWLEMIILSG